MRTLISLATVVALAAGAADRRTSNQSADVAAVIQSEKALYAAVATGDKAAFEALTVPEGAWATPSGFVPMGPLADGLGAFAVARWSIENPRVLWSAGDSALLLYTRMGGGSFASRPFASMMLASTLWIKRGGKWLAVYHQESEDVP